MLRDTRYEGPTTDVHHQTAGGGGTRQARFGSERHVEDETESVLGKGNNFNSTGGKALLQSPPLNHSTTMPLHGNILTSLRNASTARLRQVPVPSTSANTSILAVLLQQGLIHSVTKGTVDIPFSPTAYAKASLPTRRLWVTLKYSPVTQRPILSKLELISKPSRKIFMDRDEMIRWSTYRRAQFVPPLNMGEIGIVASHTKDGRPDGKWWEVREAIKNGVVAGEVVARAG